MPLLRCKWSEQIVETGGKITQTRAQVEDIRSGNHRKPTRFEHAIDFAYDCAKILEMFDRLNARNQPESIVRIRQDLPVQIGDVDALGGRFHELIGVITRVWIQRIARGNQPK